MSPHPARVRALYKALLKLHRGLPLQMKALGDQYVKSEFRLHKNAGAAETDQFMHEWTKYYVTLAKQLNKKQKNLSVGQAISTEMMDVLSPEQVGQLHELFKATTKVDDDKEGSSARRWSRGYL